MNLSLKWLNAWTRSQSFGPQDSQSRKHRGHQPLAAFIEVLEDRSLLSGTTLIDGGHDHHHDPNFDPNHEIVPWAYVTSGTSWPGDSGGSFGTTISYSYSNLLNGGMGGSVQASEYKAAIEEALALWSTYAPLHFVERIDSGPQPSTAGYATSVHPEIRIGHRYIDGNVGANFLALTYAPGPSGLNGDLHFDSGNVWTVDPDTGLDFLEVAVHEVGHALGLEHEPQPGSGGQHAVMNNTYEGLYDGLGTAYLFADDIAGIRSIYGTGSGSVTPLGSGGGDDHGNSAGFASTIIVESSIFGTIEVGSEQDWFAFQAIAGVQYTMETNLGTLDDTTLNLFGQDGTTSLVFDDDGGVGQASKIVWTATGTGWYFLKVRAFTSTQTGTYSLDVTHADDFGGTAATATVLPINSAFGGIAGGLGDQDWFKVTANAGTVYRFKVDLATLTHASVTLHGTDGTSVLLTGDGQGAGSNPWLIWNAPATGTYYLEVAAGTLGHTGTYYVHFTEVEGLVATSPGEGTSSWIRVFNASNPIELFSVTPYDPGLLIGAHVALGDVNGDGIADVISGTGAGGGPHVRVISGANGDDLMNFVPYDPAFTGGVRVAAGDVTGDGKADVITVPGTDGAPHVLVFNGADGSLLYSLLVYPIEFTGGVYISSADVNNDSKDDIIFAVGALGSPHVGVISGADGVTYLMSFYAYDPAFTGGAFIASGDVNDDGFADIVTAPGYGGGPLVRVFSGATGAELTSFWAYDPYFTGGVRLGTSDVNDDGHADIITSPGNTGGPLVRVISGANYAELTSFWAYDPYYVGGTFLAGASAATPSAMLFIPSEELSTSGMGAIVVSHSEATADNETEAAAALGRPVAALSLRSRSSEEDAESLPFPSEQPQDLPAEDAALFSEASLADVFGDRLFERLLIGS